MELLYSGVFDLGMWWGHRFMELLYSFHGTALVLCIRTVYAVGDTVFMELLYSCPSDLDTWRGTPFSVVLEYKCH